MGAAAPVPVTVSPPVHENAAVRDGRADGGTDKPNENRDDSH
jgi:hypothetical protein